MWQHFSVNSKYQKVLRNVYLIMNQGFRQCGSDSDVIKGERSLACYGDVGSCCATVREWRCIYVSCCACHAIGGKNMCKKRMSFVLSLGLATIYICGYDHVECGARPNSNISKVVCRNRWTQLVGLINQNALPR